MNLLEAYKNRLAVSEGYYSQRHDGEKMSNRKKLIVAKCLSNIDKYMKESFENSIGTQRSDMGLFNY